MEEEAEKSPLGPLCHGVGPLVVVLAVWEIFRRAEAALLQTAKGSPFVLILSDTLATTCFDQPTYKTIIGSGPVDQVRHHGILDVNTTCWRVAHNTAAIQWVLCFATTTSQRVLLFAGGTRGDQAISGSRRVGMPPSMHQGNRVMNTYDQRWTNIKNQSFHCLFNELTMAGGSKEEGIQLIGTSCYSTSCMAVSDIQRLYSTSPSLLKTAWQC